MKLFGGKRGGHQPSREPLEQPNTAIPAAEEPTAPPPPAEVQASAQVQETAGPDRKKARKRTLILILCAAVLALIAGVTVYFLWEKPPEQNTEGLVVPTVRPAVTNRPTPPPTPEPEETVPPETPEPTVEPAPEAQRREDCYTVVLLGMDQIGTNTDVVLVFRLDAAAKTLDVVSLPRDTLVNVSWGVKKLSTLYGAAHGDMESVSDTLCGLLGFAVDAYAVVNARAVEQVVDTMGGVNFYVPRDMDYDDPAQGLSIHLSEGFQYLNGENVMKVLRFYLGNDGSGYVTGDLGRINMQHELLKSVGEQLLQRGSIPNLKQVIEIFSANVQTDLSGDNLAWFAREFLTIPKENMHFYTAPGHSVGIRGGSYYELEPEAWLTILNDGLNPYDQPITEDNLDILRSLADGSGAVSTTGELISIDSFLNFYELG